MFTFKQKMTELITTTILSRVRDQLDLVSNLPDFTFTHNFLAINKFRCLATRDGQQKCIAAEWYSL